MYVFINDEEDHVVVTNDVRELRKKLRTLLVTETDLI